MFGENQIVGRKFFDDNAPSKEHMMITSVFYTLQGEGPFSGKPAVFVRGALCNLACPFCDTFFDKGDWLTPGELEQRTTEAMWRVLGEEGSWVNPKNGTPSLVGLVITGGEPMIQPALIRWVNEQAASNRWAFVQVETNGVYFSSELDSNVHLVVSPKAVNVEGLGWRMTRPANKILDRAQYLKFVLSADPENAPHHKVPEWALEWADKHPYGPARRSRVYVSPMNVYQKLPQQFRINFQGSETLAERSTVDEVVSFWEEGLLDRDTNKANHEHAAKEAVMNGFSLSLQVHLYASLA